MPREPSQPNRLRVVISEQDPASNTPASKTGPARPIFDLVGLSADPKETSLARSPADGTFGNVPASGKAPGGLLRHKGWKASSVDLPQTAPSAVLAAAELEIE